MPDIPQPSDFVFFAFVIAQKRANTTECRYSMSSSFFSPGSNTEGRGRGVKQNRPGQQNPRGCPVQESASKWITFEWLVIRPGSMPSAEIASYKPIRKRPS